MEEVSLPKLFSDAKMLYHTLECKYNEEGYAQCTKLLEEVAKRVDSLGLFSSNEGLEDLQTPSLSFLTVDYYLAKVQSNLRVADTQKRLFQLEVSKAYHGLFQDRLEQYAILDEDTARLIKAVPDPLLIREVKIARMKTVALLKGQAEEAKTLLDGEDSEREGQLIELRQLAIDSASELESIEMEISLLQSRHGSDHPNIPSNKASKAIPTSKITQPFMLVKDRQQLKGEVFRPGHNLPTMTIDEYLELERQRGGIQSSAPRPKGLQDEDADDDRDEVAEERRERDIRFDAFKDDNPRGWGNTYNLS